MASSNDIVAVICHGGFLTPQPYQPFIQALKAKGIETHCPQLPSSDLTKLNVGDIQNPDYNREPPEGGYPQGEHDAKLIVDILRPLIDEQGKRVLMIGHSAGGWVATEASRPELQERVRKEKGLRGGIIGIFYISAILVPVGESITSFSQPKDGPVEPPPGMKFYKHGLISTEGADKLLFNDLEEPEAQKWAKTLTAGPGFNSKLTNNAYAALPLAYLVTERDVVMPKEHQEGMVALQSQKTGELTIYRCQTGHFPQLSWTDGLVGAVQDFIIKVKD
ncbi:Alpha/beta hydrolase fold-1 [Hypoxylon trugodes]|uniref:Alpha/beta hydrolase fold-1 n=1 Tax=Hypoxylon trugodes TaxID=326681 RepID=UPI0021975B02|nr:Alpha/beta hydrolase fold-1 [Hypoxylon trugodes]KAI1387315.1 Alpha/beta hydrolase fold-1 [Hypoxylon trugodes]